ncbi:MAG: hypothetical protein RL088_2792 [Verrucomicrobiota bacterium]|jgi:hypothetical protein
MILPLFARELTETAARRRTYTMRAVFGVMLYTVFLLTVNRVISKAGVTSGSFAVLGTGRELFARLVEFLCWSVLLFQPALVAGRLTYEKERESLSLLLLTGMSPGRIVLEKYFAGLLPMVSLLLLGLPAGAITMGYGGVSPALIGAGVGVVAATCIQTAALGIFSSAWCRTTTGAISLSYGLVALVHFSMPALAALWGWYFAGEDGVRETPEWGSILWPPDVFQRIMAAQDSAGGSAIEIAALTWEHCRALVASGVVFLLFSTLVVERRATTPASTNRIARKVAVKAGRVIRWWRKFWPVRRDLPGDSPVSWRESGRGILGGRGRFARLVFWLSLGTLLLCVGLYRLPPLAGGAARIQVLGMFIGAAMVIVLVTRSTGSLLDERVNQTLDILLTTRLGAREILRQKVEALTRYRVLFWLLLAIVFAAQGWSLFSYVRANMSVRGLAQFFFCGTIAATVYPAMIIWLSMLVALLVQSKVRAVVITVTILAVWFAGPLLVLDFAYDNWRMDSTGRWLALTSPLGILDANANDRLAYFATEAIRAGRKVTTTGSPGAGVAYNFTIYSILTLVLRWTCFLLAERALRTMKRGS